MQYMGKREQGGRIAVLTSPPWPLLELECNRCTLRPDRNTGVQCSECGRRFRRPGDMKRHKCVAVRARPVKEQRGAVQFKGAISCAGQEWPM